MSGSALCWTWGPTEPEPPVFCEEAHVSHTTVTSGAADYAPVCVSMHRVWKRQRDTVTWEVKEVLRVCPRWAKDKLVWLRLHTAQVCWVMSQQRTAPRLNNAELSKNHTSGVGGELNSDVVDRSSKHYT